MGSLVLKFIQTHNTFVENCDFIHTYLSEKQQNVVPTIHLKI